MVEMKKPVSSIGIGIAAVFVVILIVGLGMNGLSATGHNVAETALQKRARILGELTLAIDDMVDKGEYRCCIDPPCTMCYMGNWIWDDGICRCDEMIVNGEMDKVCPQCLNGIEDGLCKSTKETDCEI